MALEDMICQNLHVLSYIDTDPQAVCSDIRAPAMLHSQRGY